MPKKNKLIKMIAAIIMLLIFVIYTFTDARDFLTGAPSSSKTMKFTETSALGEYESDSFASFYSYDSKNYFYCTKDGMRYMSSAGELKWSESFAMSAPVMISNCGVVAVAEQNGNAVYVYDQNGLMHNIHLEYPLIGFSVNKSGTVSVILQKDSGYLLEATSKSSMNIWSSPREDENKFPLSISVSDDNRLVAFCMLDINNVNPKSQITFGYIRQGDNGKNSDGIFSGVVLDDEFVTSVRFVGNTSLIVVSDAAIRCYSLEKANSYELAWELPLNNKIDNIAYYGDKGFCFVTGDALLNKDADPVGQLKFYSVSGELTGTFLLDRKASTLSMGYNYALVGCGSTFYAVSNKGAELWTYSMPLDIRQAVFLDNTDTVLFAGSMRYSVMKRQKTTQTEMPPIVTDEQGLEE